MLWARGSMWLDVSAGSTCNGNALLHGNSRALTSWKAAERGASSGLAAAEPAHNRTHRIIHTNEAAVANQPGCADA